MNGDPIPDRWRDTVVDRLLGDTKEPYYGAAWLESAYQRHGLKVGRLGARVAALLNSWAAGIYHLGHQNPKKWTFDNETWVEFIHTGYMATVDSNDLTRLVFLAHDFCLRVDVSAVAPRRFRFLFPERQRDGGISERHPTLEQAVTIHRAQGWPAEEPAHAV